jgi:hypothetical protein
MRNIQLQPTQVQNITTTGAKKGVNLRDNPQMINVDFAQVIENYQALADGRLIKTKGLRLHRNLGSEVVNLYEKWDDWLLVYSQGTTLYILDERDDTTYTVKDDFAESRIKGVRYGEYFFTGSNDTQLTRVEKRINYSNLVGTINVGDSVIDADTNQRIAEVLETGSGYVVVKDFSTTSPASASSLEIGSATCDLDSYEYFPASISNAPEVEAINLIATRLYVGSGNTVYFSEVDAGSNPPFDTWSTSTSADGSGSISFKRAGRVKSIEPLGQYIVVFQEKGKFAFEHRTIDSNGTLKRVDISNVNRLDDGGSTATVSTPQGIFYLNEAGLWQLITLGVKNTPFTEQDIELSQLLGAEYFDKVNLSSDPSIFYDAASQTVFLSLANDSTVNNELLAYRTEFKSFTTITNWSIQTFYIDGRDFYGTSSVDGKVYKLFTSHDNDGIGIRSIYKQEIQTGDLTTRKDLIGVAIGANISEDSNITVSFDIHDEDGQLIENVVRLEIDETYKLSNLEGYYELGYGGAWGGKSESSKLIPVLLDSNAQYRNYTRLILKIEDFSKAQHEINYVRLIWREKSPVTKRQITKL